jgi:archaeal flagellin FlaB
MTAISKLIKDQKGMTGLETAIILIAFVTVAAVFGYAVLSAGLFSAEQGKETIYAGLQEASSNLRLTGSVIAKSTDDTNVSSIVMTVGTTPSGNPIDMTACDGTTTATNKCVISLTSAESYVSNVKWSARMIGNSSGNLLKAGGQCEITIDTFDLGDGKALAENLTVNDKFNVQIKPAVGATITIERSLPASISGIMDLN